MAIIGNISYRKEGCHRFGKRKGSFTVQGAGGVHSIKESGVRNFNPQFKLNLLKVSPLEAPKTRLLKIARIMTQANLFLT